MTQDVLRLSEIKLGEIKALLLRYGLAVQLVEQDHPIPGSYWGDDEAGLIADVLFARSDTPVHSILHEASHWITCSPTRRANLHTDAADNQLEENASCFLQIILSDFVPGMGRDRALVDMDHWGYSFRLGNAKDWFSIDADEEKNWLITHGVLNSKLDPTFRVRS